VKVFIDSDPKRSENSCFHSSNAIAANREVLKSMPKSGNTKSVFIIAQRVSEYYQFGI